MILKNTQCENIGVFSFGTYLTLKAGLVPEETTAYLVTEVNINSNIVTKCTNSDTKQYILFDFF